MAGIYQRHYHLRPLSQNDHDMSTGEKHRTVGPGLNGEELSYLTLEVQVSGSMF